ncbi:hypothetical protein ACHAXS_002640 [Conticribra weissflogii]
MLDNQWEQRRRRLTQAERLLKSLRATTLFALAIFSIRQILEDPFSNQRDGTVRHLAERMGWVRPNVVYGFLHMAKAAGTEINGELANQYERVCGNKGYSYDALKQNVRTEDWTHSKAYAERWMKIMNAKTERNDDQKPEKNRRRLYNRGSVPIEVSNEIGFDDCDYIALEHNYEIWMEIAQDWPLELHVPCRDPLEHLMSQCNFKFREFNCEAEDLENEVKSCMVHISNRFNSELEHDTSIHLKCFNPIPVDRYLDYMGTLLQPKRIQSEYIHRESNKPRNKTAECLWTAGEEFKTKVYDILMAMDYYNFCSRCMGSKHELIPMTPWSRKAKKKGPKGH